MVARYDQLSRAVRRVVELAVHLASFIFEKRPTDRKDGEKIADFDGTLFRTSEGWGKYGWKDTPLPHYPRRSGTGTCPFRQRI
jgi:hypothetical protein